MTEIFLTGGALQVIVPLLLLFWQLRECSVSKAQWLFKTILAASYLAAVAIAGLWSWFRFFLPYLFLMTSLAFAARDWFWVRALPIWSAETRWQKIRFGLTALLAAFALGLTFYVLSGWRIPSDSTVKLAFPLRGGSFYIANGGSNSLINPHLNTFEGERFRPYRGQSYAVDIMQINQYGLRANGFLPADPAEYAIFGTPVYSPCAGAVI